MEMYGIKFNNRAKKSEGDDAAQTSAQFAAFAGLCASLGYAKHVHGVEYSSNWCVYSIDVDHVHEGTEVGGGIEWAADQTLQQFEIFGRVEHKGGLDEADWYGMPLPLPPTD